MCGRLVLGKNYFVSSGFGAQLFAGHQLVTSGPFSLMRHPMYTGLFLGALGSILIYPTWTTLFFAIFTPFVWVRAWREETALAAEFGEQWREYCRRVPAIFPRLR
jgi:protein-S-isoprenylcysteine O-methyltransferase Ste14